MDKYGRRCYLVNRFCQEETAKKCLNTRQCIPDDPLTSANERATCSCTERFDVDRYPLNETQIDIDPAIPNLKASLLVHFITVNSHPSALSYQPNELVGPHGRSTKFKQIQFHRDLVTIFLVFAQSNSTQQVHLRIKAEDQHRCLAIVELFDGQIVRCPCLRLVNNNSTFDAFKTR